uniref:Small cysteine-rich protein 1 1 n=1 Tax=Montipora capitata TaxID=46704 RepID=SCR1A_MONCP|nr:RecName: Full=Small cysteine-rich protein 1 1; Short=Mcap-SCRiP1a; Short=SCRiP1a; Flags: Precursor [Montipora capitata]DAA06485.1 TPA_inf: small cysteine-rich protein 1a [Montipora capitata]
MGVHFNICLLLLLVATISSQTLKATEKDDSTDENPFGIYRRGSQCAVYGGRCIPTSVRCPPNTFQCDLSGCSWSERCCCHL